MRFSDKLIMEYREKADKGIAVACRWMMGLMLLVVLLNEVGVFKINRTSLNSASGIAIALFFVPTILTDILKLKAEWVRYLILFSLVVQSGVLYALLSYHTILMLTFPIVIACLYSKRRYILFTGVITIPMVVISHLVAFTLKVVPDEPLDSIRGVVFYGILPRVIELIAFAVVGYFIASRSEKMTYSLIEKNECLYKDQEALVETLAGMIEEQSGTTGQHVKRVSEYTAILCRGLGYDEDEVWKISLASMMHDAGKLMIPPEIIEKPGKLTEEEFEIVKKHADYGFQMLEKAPGEIMMISAKIALEHHEKWNGKGYHRIEGEMISKYARCVALADVFDALVSRRPYKEPWTPEQAFEEIVHQKGEHFDPQIVEIFVKHFEEFKEIVEKYPN